MEVLFVLMLLPPTAFVSAPLLDPPGVVAAPWLLLDEEELVLASVPVVVELLGALVELPAPLLGCSPVLLPPPWF